MGERTGFEEQAAQAWRRFQVRLADRLAAMGEDDVLVVEEPDVGIEETAGATPYAQFCVWDGCMVRGEVSSNRVLKPGRALSTAGEIALLGLGYQEPATPDPDVCIDPGSLNFFVDVERGDTDRLAVMTVRALRDVFGVAHPALLSADGLENDGPAWVEATLPAAEVEPEEPLAVFPDGAEELQRLVDAAIAPYLGQPPEHDEDGDIPLAAGSTVLFLRVAEKVPVVEMFACLAFDVDAERARFEVNVLNRDTQFVKFRLVDDQVHANLSLPAWPFVPEHLRAMVEVMVKTIEQVEADLEARVASGGSDSGGSAPAGSDAAGGPAGSDPDGWPVAAVVEDEPSYQRPWRILAELEAQSPGSVDPELAASVCGQDADVVLRLLDVAAELDREWRVALEESVGLDDAGEIAACEREIDRLERTAILLRAVLRVVVEREAQSPSKGRRPARASARPSRRRVPDPTIEEVDPEIWS